MFNKQPFSRGKFNTSIMADSGIVGLPAAITLTAEDAQINIGVSLTADALIALDCPAAELSSNMLTAEPCLISLISNDAILAAYRVINPAACAITLGGGAATLSKHMLINSNPCVMSLAGNAAINIKLNLAGNCPIALSGKAALDFLSSEFIDLSNMVLAPGKMLIIDAKAMTITIDGVNAMGKLSGTSNFFNLKEGMNTITYTGGQPAEVRVLWKDRYL